jgi:hypothetical protein
LSGFIVTLARINSVNSQAVDITTTKGEDGSHSFTGSLPGTSSVTITPVPGLQNDFTTPCGEIIQPTIIVTTV